MDDEARLFRVRMLAVVMACLVVILVGRLGYLQLVQGEALAATAQRQAIKAMPVPAPRGDILDRNEVPLATTRPAFTTSLVYTGEELSADQRQELAAMLHISEALVEETVRELRQYPFRPALLKMDLTETEAASVAAEMHRFPGLLLDVSPVRVYPHGTLASHLLGYVGNISEADLQRWDGHGFAGPDVVGRTGIERLFTFPEYLQGEKGMRWLTVDARGRPLGQPAEDPPVPGHTVRLTIDAALQAAAEAALAETLARLQQGVDPLLRRPNQLSIPAAPGEDGVELSLARQYPDARAGAVVAMDVRTGAILAMASYPDFDPNDFALRAYYRPGDPRYQELDERVRSLTDGVAARRDAPLLFRVLESSYSPGSAYKPVTALAGLDAGQSVSSIFCGGLYHTPFTGLAPRRDWLASGHGTVNLESALARSCNIYFYRQAEVLGWNDNPTLEAAQRMGLGTPTGLQVGPPPDPAYRLWPWSEVPGYLHSQSTGEWHPGDVYSIGIGQISRATPLQLANMIAAIANGGRLLEPYLVEAVLTSDGDVIEAFGPGEGREVDFDPAHLAAVQSGLIQVTRPGGTGYSRFLDWDLNGFPVQVAAKTGTAEVTGRDSHGVFIAYGPATNPEIAVAVVIEHGGGGNLAAGPVVRAVLDAYFGYAEYMEVRRAAEVGQEAAMMPPGNWRLP